MKFLDENLRKPCVYRIWNVETSISYIGASAFSAFSRYEAHLKMLKQGIHHCDLLQREWDSFNEDSFFFEILEYTSALNVWEKEQEWWDKFSVDGCYNRRPRGSYNAPMTELVKKQVAEKVSATMKAKIASGERLTGWEYMVAKHGEDEARRLNTLGNKAAGGKGNKGKPKSESHRQKMSEAAKDQKASFTKDDLVKSIDNGAKSIEDLCKEYGYSRPTLRKYLDKYNLRDKLEENRIKSA